MTLNEESYRERLPHLLPGVLAAKIEASGKHPLHDLTRIHRDGQPDFFRCQVEAHLSDGGTEFHVLDLTAKYVGTILQATAEAARNKTGEASLTLEPQGRKRLKLVGSIPRWAGSVSYGPVAEHARRIADSGPMKIRSTDNPARQALSIIEASHLRDAHVIRVDPEQVEVLPEWESDQEAIEFGIDAQLPFETVYLDFEGVGGIAPHAGLDAYDSPLTITGALMFRQGTDILVVAPYGWAGPREKIGDRDSHYESPGWFMFDRDRLVAVTRDTGEINHPAVADKEMLLDPDGTGALAATVATDYCIGAFLDEGDAPEEMKGLPGWAVLPFHRGLALEAWGKPEDEHSLMVERIMWWSDLLWKLTKKAMAALSIVEAEEVELVEARMEKRDRKRAVKRGWPIADQVVIRPRKRYNGDRPAPSGEEARYSHRFWRRGTYAHYPLGTRIADARPDLVKPCARIEGNCGFCRRVWHPPTIVGPEDKPLVLKTLVQHPKKKAS